MGENICRKIHLENSEKWEMSNEKWEMSNEQWKKKPLAGAFGTVLLAIYLLQILESQQENF